MAFSYTHQNSIEKIANLGSYEVDMSTGFWTGSENFIDIFQLPQKEKYSQQEFQDLVHPEDYDEVMGYFAKCLEEQRDFNYEYRCVLPSGKIIHVLSRSNIDYDENGTPIKVIGIKQNITARKQAELHIKTLNDLSKKKTKVMGMVAHDLRSPLSQIVGLVELLKDQAEDEEQQKFLKLIIDACMSANDIITDLIDISEIDNTLKKPNRSMIDINELIHASIDRHKFNLKKKNQEVQTQLTVPAKAYVDKAKFFRVIDNLLNNAIKFSPEDEVITICTEQQNGSLILKVEDNGVGIKEEHTPFLFEEDKTMIRREGTAGERSTGLGLTIVKQIVDMHQGEIEVESTINEGTTFSVILHNKPAVND